MSNGAIEKSVTFLFSVLHVCFITFLFVCNFSYCTPIVVVLIFILFVDMAIRDRPTENS